jgi:hypothetical protein
MTADCVLIGQQRYKQCLVKGVPESHEVTSLSQITCVLE